MIYTETEIETETETDRLVGRQTDRHGDPMAGKNLNTGRHIGIAIVTETETDRQR